MYEDLWDQEYVDRMRMKESFEDGEREGLKKGEEMGLKKGEEMGLKKGEEMGLKKGEKKHVKRMSEQGFSEQDISRILDVPSERVRAILHPQRTDYDADSKGSLCFSNYFRK